MTPDALAALHRAAFVTDRAWSADEFTALLDSTYCHLTSTQHGFALWRAVAGEAELLTIATHPAHQGRGVGSAVMRAWMDTASANATTAFLEVAADNQTAISLYSRFGFDIVARRPRYYVRPDINVDALVMRARLPFSVS